MPSQEACNFFIQTNFTNHVLFFVLFDKNFFQKIVLTYHIHKIAQLIQCRKPRLLNRGVFNRNFIDRSEL